MSSSLDLRTFLDFVRESSPREYLRVEREVSPDWEMAGIVTKLEAAMRAPVVDFRDVAGTRWPVVTNVCASLPRVARSLGWSLSDLEARLQSAYDNPVPPQLWSGDEVAPVRETVLRDDAVDLRRVPQFRYTEDETARYLTATAVVARDPDTGIANVSYHRLMIVDRRSTAIYMTPSGHLAQIVAKHAGRNEPTPVAVFVGAHPLWSLGALAAGSIDVDELAVIGGLMGEPLVVVPSEVDPALRVPARAELALEGFIRPDRLVEEGPFGEFAGYVMGKNPRPVFDVRVMSHRAEPIFQDIVAGRLEQLTMSGVTLRAHLQRTLVAQDPAVLGVHLPAPLTVFLTIDTTKLNGRSVAEVMRRLLEGQGYIKHVCCFDPDIDLKSISSTQWALATRMQPDRDVLVLAGLSATEMEPSEQGGKTSRWGIDATAKPDLEHFAPRNRVPQDILDRIDIKALTTRRG